MSDMKKRMAAGWISGLHDGTPCGLGSTLAATEGIRESLPALVRKYEIHKVCDAGAGDLHWITRMAWDVDYHAFDLIVRHPSVTALDITTERLPSADLILCRAVLNHLNDVQVREAIGLFKRAGTYLLATQFPLAVRAFGDFSPLDLREYGLGEPLESLRDHPGELALWKL